MGAMTGPHDFEELPPIVADRRAPRRKALLSALAVSRDGSRTVECAIREISASGAKLQVPKDQVIPAHFYLLVGTKDLMHEAAVIWVGAKEIGLKFLNTYRSEELIQPDMQFLRRLLVERLPRAGNDILTQERRRVLVDSGRRKPFRAPIHES